MDQSQRRRVPSWCPTLNQIFVYLSTVVTICVGTFITLTALSGFSSVIMVEILEVTGLLLVYVVIFLIGVIVMLSALIGFCGKLRESRGLMCLYSSTSMLSSLAILVVGTLVFLWTLGVSKLMSGSCHLSLAQGISSYHDEAVSFLVTQCIPHDEYNVWSCLNYYEKNAHMKNADTVATIAGWGSGKLKPIMKMMSSGERRYKCVAQYDAILPSCGERYARSVAEYAYFVGYMSWGSCLALFVTAILACRDCVKPPRPREEEEESLIQMADMPSDSKKKKSTVGPDRGASDDEQPLKNKKAEKKASKKKWFSDSEREDKDKDTPRKKWFKKKDKKGDDAV
eukprot:Platyproteum_vivax@DN6692_c0_g1_i3.p1